MFETTTPVASQSKLPSQLCEVSSPAFPSYSISHLVVAITLSAIVPGFLSSYSVLIFYPELPRKLLEDNADLRVIFLIRYSDVAVDHELYSTSFLPKIWDFLKEKNVCWKDLSLRRVMKVVSGTLAGRRPTTDTLAANTNSRWTLSARICLTIWSRCQHSDICTEPSIQPKVCAVKIDIAKTCTIFINFCPVFIKVSHRQTSWQHCILGGFPRQCTRPLQPGATKFLCLSSLFPGITLCVCLFFVCLCTLTKTFWVGMCHCPGHLLRWPNYWTALAFPFHFTVAPKVREFQQNAAVSAICEQKCIPDISYFCTTALWGLKIVS